MYTLPGRGYPCPVMLKAAMAGEEVKPGVEKKWNPNVKAINVELIGSSLR